jgi:DUF4097 and DUF4098 domain-containing protein YvlB
LAVVTAAVALGGCAAPHRVSETFSTVLPWEGYERVEIATRNGAVTVRSSEVDDVRIEGRKVVSTWHLEEGEALLSQLVVEMGPRADDAGVLRVALDYPDSLREANPGVSLVVALPRRCPVQVRTSNGRIELEGLDGEVAADTSNGRIEVRDVRGPLRVETSNGRVTLEDVQGDVEVKTSNGRITAGGLLAGSCRLRTSNGAIRADVTPAADAPLMLRTSNGSIHLTVPDGLGARLVCDTSNGRVVTSLKDATLRHVEADKQHFEAELNGGGPVWELDTSNGRIDVRMQ